MNSDYSIYISIIDCLICMIYFDMTTARRSDSELCFRSSLSTTGFPTSCKHKKGHKKKNPFEGQCQG